jgi:hypothetical protein
MQLGDHNMVERAERSPLNVVLDRLNNVYAELLDTIECGGLDQLNAAEKISFWQEFEAFRCRLPLIDHRLIADAEATDLAGTYCFSSLTMLLTRRLLLSPTEAAARVRAAAAVGTRTATDGESLDPVLPNLAAAQREGTVSAEQLRIVERAMQKLSRPDLSPGEVAAAERQLAKHAQELGPKDLRLVADRIVDVVDPDRPEPVDDQLQQDRRHLVLKQRRDGMWQLEGRLTNTVVRSCMRCWLG